MSDRSDYDRDVRAILEYVSRGSQFWNTPTEDFPAGYPDAAARRALGALTEAPASGDGTCADGNHYYEDGLVTCRCGKLSPASGDVQGLVAKIAEIRKSVAENYGPESDGTVTNRAVGWLFNTLANELEQIAFASPPPTDLQAVIAEMDKEIATTPWAIGLRPWRDRLAALSAGAQELVADD